MRIIDSYRISEFAFTALTDHERRSPVILKRESMFRVTDERTGLTDQIFATTD